MNEERRQIIVREIQHWSRSKLLPDQYCDFLLNLYMDHDKETKRESSHSITKAVMAVQHASGKHWLLTFGFFTFISFVVLYFNVFHPLLQIGVSAVAVIGLLWYGARLRRRYEAAGLAVTGTGMLLMLGSGLYILKQNDWTDWGWKAVMLGFCALFWVVYGIASRIQLLHLCGWLAGIMVYAWLLAEYTSLPAWYESQLYWMPISILFGWASWFVHRWSKPSAMVLFAVCAILWFMPELYEMIVWKEPVMLQLQLQLLVKIAAGGGLLFFMRKQWMVWVA
ncbi:hypothetical protein SAMN05216378_4711 [Paenibacillus catalpae]|uniref:DUF2157 domain-containing protein n=1 Tax=Paenibacillus catalpae TaxID=1045775 RepID=A0A1I2F742_9BACL|nr:hypothetical protein [Paenibacillus catalpae]SFF00789.1 hypothetical protein SAMN05216378_4711 [Paenibacillus catalpae]